MNRTATLFLVLVLVVATAGVAWLAGSRIQSPAEAAARTAPPTPSPILVPVEERVLTSDIVTRGTARYGMPQAITVVPSALKSGAGVVTSVPAQDTQVEEGDVVLTASGRPVFVLQGEIPIFRDLVPGLTGEDVRQLEEALTRLGHDPGTIDGRYDEHLSTAVAAWCADAGWQAFGPTPGQVASIQALERELATARNEALAAADKLAAAPLAVEAARAAAETALQAAEAEVAARSAVHDLALAGPDVTEEELASAAAELDLAQAAAQATRLDGEVKVQAALDAQKAAERAADLADRIVARIEADLDSAQIMTGVQVPADELVFVPALPVRVEQILAQVGDAAAGPLLIVTNHQRIVDSSLPLDEAPLIKPGMMVTIDEPDLGIEATGTVGRVAATPGTDGADGFHVYFETLVDETPTDIEGFSLRLTIPVESTGGAVTVVPVSALSLSADGKTRIQVERDGTLEYIVVKPGLSASGFVEVEPVEGTLAPGQLVVIGFDEA